MRQQMNLNKITINIFKKSRRILASFELKKKFFSVALLILVIFLIFKGIPVTSWGPGANYRNYSVHTQVNVTNAYPEVLNVTCSGNYSGVPSAAITLTAGNTKTVYCLAQVRDYNGGNTVISVNATFYYYSSASSDPDENNTHYTNTSCTMNNSGGYYSNWTCAFDVWYYANNGTWRANATANDSYSTTNFNYGNATVSALLALNVTSLINFGSLAVTETSQVIQANVTNFGNVPINFSVHGFGGEDPVLYAGLAMICDQRNISISNERYSLNGADTYDIMTQITGSPVTVNGTTIQKQTIPNTYMINSTYWTLHVNLTTNPFGICNGTVIFAAQSP
jgi:hypothetical protein